MKFFRLLSHPYTLIICFLLVIISGEHWGGFYVLYILMALAFGGIHALLALGGVFALLISHHWLKDQNILRQLLNLAGVFLLFLSLYCFFVNDKEHYNWGTFHDPVSLFTLTITAVVTICFIAKTCVDVTSRKLILPD